MLQAPTVFLQAKIADRTHYEAIKLLARARHERLMGRLDSAEGLLNQIFTLAEADPRVSDCYPYFAAHVEFYRVYRDTGRVKEAGVYFNKAIKLGATAEQLKADN